VASSGWLDPTRFAVTILRSLGTERTAPANGVHGETRVRTVTDTWPIALACGIMSDTTQTMGIEDGSGWSGAA